MNVATIASNRLASIGRAGLGARVKRIARRKRERENRNREKREKKKSVVIQKEERKDQEKPRQALRRKRSIYI